MHNLKNLDLPIHAIIFDMDGTMVDSMPTHKKSWMAFAKQHGIVVDEDDLMRRTTGLNGAESMRVALAKPNLRDEEAWALIHEKEVIYRELFAAQFIEISGFCAYYEQLRVHGIPIAIGTAGDAENVAFVLKHLAQKYGFHHPPSVIVRGDQGLRGKPAPDIFLEAARQLGVDPKHCVVFEDAPLGIEAARRAGMQAVGVCSTSTAAELAGAHVIRTVNNYQTLIGENYLF